jgi:hypothetical protein
MRRHCDQSPQSDFRSLGLSASDYGTALRYLVIEGDVQTTTEPGSRQQTDLPFPVREPE